MGTKQTCIFLLDQSLIELSVDRIALNDCCNVWPGFTLIVKILTGIEIWLGWMRWYISYCYLRAISRNIRMVEWHLENTGPKFNSSLTFVLPEASAVNTFFDEIFCPICKVERLENSGI